MQDRRGFTLVEVIAAIVLAAIASALLIQFMGDNMGRSLAPLSRIDRSYLLTAVTENITAHYKSLLITDATPLATLDNDIRNGNVSTNTPYFGEYEDTTPQYIQFTNETEAACSVDCRILRVDLKQGEHRLTVLFTN
jgi:prepilin-type N-terminal cleavage/methylation domain-containing protein